MKRSNRPLVLIIFVIAGCLLYPWGPPKEPTSSADRADAVKEAFVHAWKGYKKYAFPHNELLPVSKSWADSRSAWGATAVDSLSTAILMDLPDVVTTIMQHIETIDFPATPIKVSLFQATKTFIGGMLSAYDLLTGPKSYISTGTNPEVLLQKAQILADSLAFAFDTPSQLAQNNVMLQPVPKHRKVSTTDITAAGTLILDWTRLSDLAHKKLYSDLVEQNQQAIFNAPHDKCDEPFPGLLSKTLRLKNGRILRSEGGWGDSAGSYYEYLMKMYIYSPNEYAPFRDRWIKAVNSSMKVLASHPSSRPDHTFLAAFNCTLMTYTTDHSSFFSAGNIILGGSVLNKKKYIDFGLRLIESQVQRCQATRTGLCPEVIAWLPEKCKKRQNANHKACQFSKEFAPQKDFYNKYGYYTVDPSSRLRPEVLESLYYAYRVTGDRKYQDMSWEIFKAIDRWAKMSDGGFSEVENVHNPTRPYGPDGRIDRMYGYFLAQTLKYAYLIHTEDAEWQTQKDGNNTWVFTTQAHPVKVRHGVKSEPNLDLV